MVDEDPPFACQLSNSFKSAVLPGRASRPCRYVLNTLMQVFMVEVLSHSVMDDHLKELLVEMLLLLLDERLATSVEDGPHLIKALNVLMLKILVSTHPPPIIPVCGRMTA